MRTKISKKILYLTLILLPNIAFSQTEELLKKGTDLHLEYRFEEAIGIYNQILNSGADSTLSLEVDTNTPSINPYCNGDQACNAIFFILQYSRLWKL